MQTDLSLRLAHWQLSEGTFSDIAAHMSHLQSFETVDHAKCLRMDISKDLAGIQTLKDSKKM